MIYLTPLWIGLCVAGGVGILGLLFVPGPDKSLNRLLVVVACICLYMMWLMVYMSQMNPLLLPMDTRFSDPTTPLEARDYAAHHWNAHNGPINGRK